MARESTEFRRIEERERALRGWITHNAPECFEEQKHLEEGSQERVYWHYGYMTALRDVVRLMNGQNTFTITDHNEDTSTSIPPA